MRTDSATTGIYTPSLHDALPIFHDREAEPPSSGAARRVPAAREAVEDPDLVGDGDAAPVVSHPEPHLVFAHRGSDLRSEEHTSELQSQSNLVCRLLLEKKTKQKS